MEKEQAIFRLDSYTCTAINEVEVDPFPLAYDYQLLAKKATNKLKPHCFLRGWDFNMNTLIKKSFFFLFQGHQI